MSLDGRVAVVTGGAGGIGREYCGALAAAGATVVVADLEGGAARAAADAITASGGRALPFELDVSRPECTLALGAFVRSSLGRCDVLVNNAAIYRGVRYGHLDVDIDYWRSVFAVNVDGALLCTQALAPLMIEARWGRVVNQASIAAYQAFGGPYGVSKLALVGLTQGLARELGPHGITVNAITPGIVYTEATIANMPAERLERRLQETPIARRAVPADLTGLLLFLVSDAGGWVTGQSHVIDGGLLNRL